MEVLPCSRKACLYLDEEVNNMEDKTLIETIKTIKEDLEQGYSVVIELGHRKLEPFC